MRRLLTALCVLGTLVIPLLVARSAGAAPAQSVSLPAVDVINVTGLIDPVQADFLRKAVTTAANDGAEALIVQLNSGGGVLSKAQLADLTFRISHAAVPVAVWVGPSGKGRAQGAAFAILRSAGIVGVANATRVDGMSAQQALERGLVHLDAPTLVSFVGQLDGKSVNGQTIHKNVKVEQGEKGPVGRPEVQVRFAKLGLLASLMHTVASPSVAYLLLVIGLLLMVFEFFTAGVGVAAVVGAGFFVLSAYGLSVL